MKPTLNLPSSHSKSSIILKLAFLGGLTMAVGYGVLMFFAAIVSLLN